MNHGRGYVLASYLIEKYFRVKVTWHVKNRSKIEMFKKRLEWNFEYSIFNSMFKLGDLSNFDVIAWIMTKIWQTLIIMFPPKFKIYISMNRTEERLLYKGQ